MLPRRRMGLTAIVQVGHIAAVVPPAVQAAPPTEGSCGAKTYKEVIPSHATACG